MLLKNPDTLPNKIYDNTSGQQQALDLFRQAAARIPAYKDFLNQHNIDPSQIQTMADFAQVPYMDKTNYITKYPLDQLCWDGQLRGLNYIVSSSGSSGEPFYWPRGEAQDQISAYIYLEIFRDIFSAHLQPTLVINSYGQGTWIAGTELYTSMRMISDYYPNFSVINTGIDAELAVKQISKLSGHYSQLIICGYPPFLKDIIDLGVERGLSWQTLKPHLVTAGEAISPAWRKHILQILGYGQDTAELAKIINLYGLADAGVVAAESPATLALRAQSESQAAPEILGGNQTVSLGQFHPDLRYFESDQENKIILTTLSGIPLIRYDTKDYGVVASAQSIQEYYAGKMRPKDQEILQSWQAPYLGLFGRKDFSITLYAVNVYADHVRASLDQVLGHGQLTGRFVMAKEMDLDMNPVFVIRLELATDQQPRPNEKSQLVELITQNLRKQNSEYNELYEKVGSKVTPQLKFEAKGSISYESGKKHKWVKPD